MEERVLLFPVYDLGLRVGPWGRASRSPARRTMTWSSRSR